MVTSDISGSALRSGSVTVTASDAARLEDVLGSPRPSAGLHPLFAFIAAQRGIGVSVAELCEIAEFDVEDGPLLGSLDIEWSRPLHANAEYAVEGEINSLVRKHGRSGVFDVLTFQERLVDTAGVAATVDAIFILPRHGRAGGTAS